jgi:hypothetical protein
MRSSRNSTNFSVAARVAVRLAVRVKFVHAWPRTLWAFDSIDAVTVT